MVFWGWVMGGVSKRDRNRGGIQGHEETAYCKLIYPNSYILYCDSVMSVSSNSSFTVLQLIAQSYFNKIVFLKTDILTIQS